MFLLGLLILYNVIVNILYDQNSVKTVFLQHFCRNSNFSITINKLNVGKTLSVLAVISVTNFLIALNEQKYLSAPNYEQKSIWNSDYDKLKNIQNLTWIQG